MALCYQLHYKRRSEFPFKSDTRIQIYSCEMNYSTEKYF